jgi:type VI protein secretion system component Hcp
MFGSRLKQEGRRSNMKKTTKKSPSKASHKKAVKDLDVTPAKGGSVRGGITKSIDKSSAVLFQNCTTGEHKP